VQHPGTCNQTFWELSAFSAAMSLIDKSLVAGRVFALGDIVGSLLLVDALLDHIHNRSIARAGVFQFAQRFSGKHGQSLRAPLRDGQNYFVGKAGAAQGLRLAGPQSKLIQACQLQHRSLGGARGEQICDGLAAGERLPTAARKPDQLDAGRVGKACLPGFRKFADFSIRDIQAAKLVDAIEPHARVVERLRIGLLGALTSSERQQQSQEQPKP
jgi:hypothetical protein